MLCDIAAFSMIVIKRKSLEVKDSNALVMLWHESSTLFQDWPAGTGYGP